MRLQGDPDAAEFSQWLLDVGQVRIPNEMLINDAANLVNSIYPGNDSPQPSTFLSPRSSDQNCSELLRIWSEPLRITQNHSYFKNLYYLLNCLY